MKKLRLHPIRWIPFASFSLLLLSAVRAPGQAAPLSSAGTAPSEDETVQLSPFQVNASRDVGFVGASAVAGGRLAGDLKDMPVAYSVLTKEFIDALNITSFVGASNWLVNSSSSTQNGITDIYGIADVNFRGVGGPALKRNYFALGVNYDSYNVDRYDMARGPNAIVFGPGGIAGSATVITKAAIPGKDWQELKVSFGSWHNVRTAADINASTGDKKIAVRANVLYQESGGWRGSAQLERKRAGTLAGTWNITPTTQLRLEGETGLIERNTPGFGQNDHFLGWDGTTVFAGSAATLPSDANARGVGRLGSTTSPYFVFAPAFDSNQVINLANTANTFGGNQTAQTTIGGIPVVGTGMDVTNSPTLPYDAVVGLPASRFNLAMRGSKFVLPRYDSFVGGTNLPTFHQPFQDGTISLTQRVGKLYLEAAGFYGKDDRRNHYIAGNAFYNAYIDINQTMPSGTPNPKFLEPFGVQPYTGYSYSSRSRAVRGSAAYLLDQTRWGDYSFNVSAGIDEGKNFNSQLNDVVKRNANHSLWPTADKVQFRYYWDEVNRPVKLYTTVTDNGVTYDTGVVPGLESPRNNTQQTTTAQYVQAAVKARWFKRRMHVLAAVRNDKFTNAVKQTVVMGDFPTNWDGSSLIWAPKAPAGWYTLTYVPKDASGNPTGSVRTANSRPRDSAGARLPQYASDRFQDDYSVPDINVRKTTFSVGSVFYLTSWLSGFYNYATSFNANGANFRIDGQTFGPQLSRGADIGLRVNVGSKLSVALGTYRGSLTNQAFDPGSQQAIAINQITQANVVGDLSSGGRNARGLSDVPFAFFDSRDRKNDGYELDLVANPARGWRMMFNASVAHAFQTNAYQDLLAYWAKNSATLKQIVLDAGGTFDANNFATTAQPSTVAPDAGTAAQGWNTLYTQVLNFVSGPQKISRLVSPIANVFADYEFQTGRLRGFRIGLGANYRGREIIGFRGADTIVNPSNPTTTIDNPSVDAYTPVYSDSYIVATTALSYRFKLRDKSDMTVALNVGNLLNYRKPRFYSTAMRAPNGDLSNPSRIAVPGSFYYVDPRTITMSITWKH